MSLLLARKAAQAELSDDLHMMRVLMLVAISAKWNGKRKIKGITKLAKMDFLLRYPNCLNIAIEKEGKYLSQFDVEIKDHEKDTIESKMIRFRYGPWDGRYRRWISLLKAKGFLDVYTEGRTVIVESTELGQKFVEDLYESESYKDQYLRAAAIVKTFGGFSATKLMEFIYETFPELNDMRWGDEIEL